MIPSYEELKELKTHETFTLFMPIIGGYFRLSINEDGNNISIDYLEGGYLSGIMRKIDSKYKFNKLYKLNKVNYNGLIDLYKKLLKASYLEIKEEYEKFAK